MKAKIIKVFMACIMVAPLFTSVFAITSSELLTRLDGIATDIESMKQEYNNILATYPDVINSLSATNKETAQNLTNNLMAEDIKTKVNAIKAELASSIVPDADKVLASINNIQDDAEDLMDENKDVVEDLKSGATSLTANEAKQVIEKVKDITTSLGVNKDTTATYNSMMTTLNEAHTMALNINNRIKAVLANNTNLNLFKSTISFDILKDILDDVKDKDQTAVIEDIKVAVDGKAGSQALKTELDGIKSDTVALKNKLQELQNLEEQDILLFTDAQKTAVKNKIKAVETDYVNFAKVVIDDHAVDYLNGVVNLAYNVTVDKMIQETNSMLDYIAEYKETIEDLKDGDFTSLNISSSKKKLLKKAGLLVALGYIDIDSYNKEYVTNNFDSQIDMLKDYTVDQALDYIDYIEDTLELPTYTGVTAAVEQSMTKTENAARFTTLNNLKALETRVRNEIVKDRQSLKNKIDIAAPRVYDLYNNNILDIIERIMLLENEKTGKAFEYNALRYYIVTDAFISSNSFGTLFGIPSANQNILTFTKLTNGKVRTGSTLKITLSDDVYQTYTYAVLGDVYADGLVDARDYMAIKNQIMEKTDLPNINKAAANTYRDSNIDARDYMMIKNQIMEKDTITL